MKRASSCALFACLLLAGCAKMIVVPVPKTISGEDGVLYALPNTVVRLQIKIDKAVSHRARYVGFDKIFVPDGEVRCAGCQDAARTEYSLQKGVTFSTYGEPDPQNVYMAKFSGRGAIDQTLSMTWNDVGLLSAASASVTNRTSDVVISGLKLAAGLGTKAAGLGGDVAKKVADTCDDNPEPKYDNVVIPVLRRAGAHNSLLIDNYCALDQPQTKNLDKPERKNIADRLEQLEKAVEAFSKNVEPLLQGRDSILSGQSPTSDAVALIPILEARAADRLSVLFLGTQETKTWEGFIDVRSLSTATPTSVLKIDPRKGFCVDQAEIPPDAKRLPDGFHLLTMQECDQAKSTTLSINYYPSQAKQLFSRVSSPTSGEHSFRYRIPAQVRADLAQDDASYGAAVFSVAQLGTVVALPAKRSTKALSYDLAFVEATGALKTFKLGTTGALDAATIDALAGVGGTALDARNKAKQNEDELTVLTREDALIKLKDEICTIQQKYGLPCTIQPK